jgi:hypothetical protein
MKSQEGLQAVDLITIWWYYTLILVQVPLCDKFELLPIDEYIHNFEQLLQQLHLI